MVQTLVSCSIASVTHAHALVGIIWSLVDLLCVRGATYLYAHADNLMACVPILVAIVRAFARDAAVVALCTRALAKLAAQSFTAVTVVCDTGANTALVEATALHPDSADVNAAMQEFRDVMVLYDIEDGEDDDSDDDDDEIDD